MTAKLVIEVTRNYPDDMDLTSYQGCGTVLEAAQLDETMLNEGLIGLDELIDADNVTVSIRVLGEVKS